MDYKQTYSEYIKSKLKERFYCNETKEKFSFNIIETGFDGDDENNSYMTRMMNNNVIYSDIYDKLELLISDNEELPTKVKRISGYRNEKLIYLIDKYSDELFIEENWLHYFNILKKTINKGNFGETEFKKYLNNHNIEYTSPNLNEDKSGIDVKFSNKTAQIKTCDNIYSLNNNTIKWSGKLDINFKHIRNVDFLVIVGKKDKKMVIFETLNIWFEPKVNSIRGKIRKFIKNSAYPDHH